jgi:hypothetical protein
MLIAGMIVAAAMVVLRCAAGMGGGMGSGDQSVRRCFGGRQRRGRRLQHVLQSGGREGGGFDVSLRRVLRGGIGLQRLNGSCGDGGRRIRCGGIRWGRLRRWIGGRCCGGGCGGGRSGRRLGCAVRTRAATAALRRTGIGFDGGLGGRGLFKAKAKQAERGSHRMRTPSAGARRALETRPYLRGHHRC